MLLWHVADTVVSFCRRQGQLRAKLLALVASAGVQLASAVALVLGI
jgi:hypothetical protein